ncbi:MAG: transcriptional repressor LexA [Acutalibacteraceae bacterium]|nr:transcriptional repressor LexA [Acutalibacteraceae bacterium]
MQHLKPNQQKVFDFLKQRAQDGLPPTVREICKHTGLKSTSTVFAILANLEKMGLIEKDGKSSRAIKISGTASQVQVPIVGVVTAGVPIFASQNIEQYMPLSSDVVRKRDVFGLKVKGMSMQNAGILDGDIVYAEKTQTAEQGDIVVALIEDEATVKRYTLDKSGKVVLMPENENFEPIIPDSLTILGKVIASFREY